MTISISNSGCWQKAGMNWNNSVATMCTSWKTKTVIWGVERKARLISDVETSLPNRRPHTEMQVLNEKRTESKSFETLPMRLCPLILPRIPVDGESKRRELYEILVSPKRRDNTAFLTVG
jgi:hypothetical protein